MNIVPDFQGKQKQRNQKEYKEPQEEKVEVYVRSASTGD